MGVTAYASTACWVRKDTVTKNVLKRNAKGSWLWPLQLCLQGNFHALGTCMCQLAANICHHCFTLQCCTAKCIDSAS